MKGNLKSITWISFVQVSVACLVMASGTAALAQSDASGASEGHKACSNRTLLGDYGTQLEGTILGPNLPLRTLLMAHFDGKGNLTSVDHVVLNGKPPEEEWRPSSGTYAVNPDCTGSASVDVAPGNPPLMFHFVVVKHGEQILEVVDGGAIRGVAYRVD